MKTPRTTVLTQILIASLVPMVVVFIIVIAMINSMLFNTSQEAAREKSTLTAENVVRRMETVFATFSVQVDMLSRCLALTVEDTEAARADAEAMAVALIDSNPDIYCVWFVFEPDAFLPGARFKRSYLRRDGEIREIDDLHDADLDSPERSRWYNVPLATGQPYFDSVDYYNYGAGFEYSGTITYPVTVDGRVVGCVGLDVHYDQIFSFLTAPDDHRGVALLTTADGEIIFSNKPEAVHGSLREFSFLPADYRLLESALERHEPGLVESASPFTGENVLANLIPLRLPDASRPLHLYVETPSATMLARAVHSKYVIVLIAVIGVAVLALCVFLVARNIIKPMRHIVGSATNIAAGRHENYQALFDGSANSPNEVFMLEQSISKMLGQLREQHVLKLSAVKANHEVEKITAASEARMHFFANMSHEIRTPMNAVLGLSELLVHEELTPQQLHWVRDIKVSTESLLNVINDVLDLSKIELGKLELKLVDFDFRELAESFFSVGQFLSEKKGLRFESAIAPEVPRFIYGDPGRCRQVVMNVLGNAVKYTAQGWVRFCIHCDPVNVYFDISDSGVGIREEDADNLFRAYKRAGSDHVLHHTQGTGLGLSIALGLAELMGGGISVKSRYGVGSDFRVWLPNRPGNPAKVKTNSTRIGMRFSSKARALIVDDNRINLVAAGGLMKILGLAFDTAMSGKEAIRKVQERDYDIVFMDHMMPEMDGVTATRKIRELGGKHRHQVVVALTANVVSMTPDSFIEAGMNDFLAKPLEKRKLREILEKWLPGSAEDDGPPPKTSETVRNP